MPINPIKRDILDEIVQFLDSLSDEGVEAYVVQKNPIRVI